jgi:5-hydroxyisourate hydrolase
MSAITTHVLDTALGQPAEGVTVRLDIAGPGENWSPLAQGVTDADGRARDLLAAGVPIASGVYRLRFATGAYFAAHEVRGFYPEVVVLFHVDDPQRHYHVPLLLSPFGYSTYRGS